MKTYTVIFLTKKIDAFTGSTFEDKGTVGPFSERRDAEQAMVQLAGRPDLQSATIKEGWE